MKINDVEIRDIDELPDFVAKNNISIGIITVPKDAAQGVAEMLVDAGVKAIWNFAPIDIRVPDHIILENEHLADRLMVLAFRLQDKLAYEPS